MTWGTEAGDGDDPPWPRPRVQLPPPDREQLPPSNVGQPSGRAQPTGHEQVPARERPPVDPVSTAAFVVGGLGVVLLGIVAAVVTAVLASEVGKRARAAGRSQENAYLAMGLAFLDGAVWLFLHYRFHLPIWVG